MMEEQVLSAKLLPPRIRRHTLVRDRLQQRLAEALEVPLTILHAGPGYGKTTALATFLMEQKLASAWYSIAPGDGAVLPFLLHLIHAVRTGSGSPEVGGKGLALLQEGPGPNRSWRRAVDSLINDIIAAIHTDFFIVLDDFHLVDEVPEVVEIVEYLIKSLPPNTHVMIASRRQPVLRNLPRWRARAEVLELGRADLAFTSEEVEALFTQQYGLDLSHQQVDSLRHRTEGWVIALQLVWQGVRKGSPLQEVWEFLPAKTDRLFSYLAQEVLDRQDPGIRRFLLTTAVLDRLDAAACDTLLGRSGSDQILACLERNGLFIQAVGSGGYRYHQLFHQFLRERAQRDVETWKEHHLTAARHFLVTGHLDLAARHFLGAGQQSMAAAAVMRAAPGLVKSGRIDLLGGLLEQLEPELFTVNPELLLWRGDVARLACRFDEALTYYRMADHAFRVEGDRRGRCLALQGQGRVYLDTISPGDAEHLLHEAYQLSDSLSAEEKAELMALIAENETNRGRPADAEVYARLAAAGGLLDEDLEVRQHLRTGRLAAAMEILERQNRTEGANRNHRETPLLISLIAAMMGDRERARQAAEDGIRLGIEKGSPFSQAVGHIRLGHALQIDPMESGELAAEQYRQAIDLMDKLRVDRGKAEPLYGLCLLHGHLTHDWTVAQKHGSEAVKITGAAQDHWLRAYGLLSLASSAAATGREESSEYLRQAEEAFARVGDPYGLTCVRLWDGLLAQRSGNWERFDRSVRQALETAQKNRYDFLFSGRTLYGPRDPQASIPLLIEAQRREIYPQYAAWLLAEMGFPNPEQHPGYTLRVQVLGHFRAWRGTQEISRRDWQREKARQLLQVFITNRQRLLPKDQIIELLWPEADTETAARDFKVALNALFNALEPNRAARRGSFYIVRDGTAYGLDPESGYWLDAEEFESLVVSGLAMGERGGHREAVRSLSRALELYQGDFLQDLLYEDWCSGERERLQVLYLRAAEWLAQDAVRRGAYEDCIRLCHRILERDSCWEEAFRLLMYSYYQMGNRSMALRTYDKCVQTLRSEMGIDPMPLTERLCQRIRSSAPLESFR